MKKMLIIIAAAAALTVGGVFAFRRYIAYHTLDKGNMENPLIGELDGLTVEMVDGNFTYVDNGVLMEVITGSWESDRSLGTIEPMIYPGIPPSPQQSPAITVMGLRGSLSTTVNTYSCCGSLIPCCSKPERVLRMLFSQSSQNASLLICSISPRRSSVICAGA